jgi:hypothetical protein
MNAMGFQMIRSATLIVAIASTTARAVEGEATSPSSPGAYGSIIGDANAVTAGGGQAAGGIGIDVGTDAFSLYLLYQVGNGTTVNSDAQGEFFNTVLFPSATPGSFVGDVRRAVGPLGSSWSVWGFKLSAKYARVYWQLNDGTKSDQIDVFAINPGVQAAWDFSKMIGGVLKDQRVIVSVDLGPSLRAYSNGGDFVEARRPGAPKAFVGLESNIELYVRKVRTFLTVTWMDHGSVPGIGGIQATIGAGIRGELLSTK